MDTKANEPGNDMEKKKTTLVIAEKQTIGSIGWDTYNAYAKAAGGLVLDLHIRFRSVLV